MFANIMKRVLVSLNGRQIRGSQSVEDMRVPRVGLALFFYELDRRTEGAFPSSFFKGVPYNELTYALMEDQYDAHLELRRLLSESIPIALSEL